MLDRLVELYCDIDDFNIEFNAMWEAYLIGSDAVPRGPDPGFPPAGTDGLRAQGGQTEQNFDKQLRIPSG